MVLRKYEMGTSLRDRKQHAIVGIHDALDNRDHVKSMIEEGIYSQDDEEPGEDIEKVMVNYTGHRDVAIGLGIDVSGLPKRLKLKNFR